MYQYLHFAGIYFYITPWTMQFIKHSTHYKNVDS